MPCARTRCVDPTMADLSGILVSWPMKYSLHNWVVCHPLYTANNQGQLVTLDLSGLSRKQSYNLWPTIVSCSVSMLHMSCVYGVLLGSWAVGP